MVLLNRFVFRIPGQTDWIDSIDEIRKKCPKPNTRIEVKDTIAAGKTRSGRGRGVPIGIMPVDIAAMKFS